MAFDELLSKLQPYSNSDSKDSFSRILKRDSQLKDSLIQQIRSDPKWMEAIKDGTVKFILNDYSWKRILGTDYVELTEIEGNASAMAVQLTVYYH